MRTISGKVAVPVFLCLLALSAHGDASVTDSDLVSTFSIVAIDPESGELGVAVASRYFAVGSVVPWLEAGVGVVATQGNVNVGYGPRALELLKRGIPADQVLAQLLKEDTHDGKEGRQVAIVDSQGHIATFTGTGAPLWAGHRRGHTWSAQGNLLVGPEVVEAMGRSFDATSGELAEKLYAALKAGDDNGGDKRGRQSAALMVVGQHKGRNVNNDRYVYINVDDHEEPLQELRRLLDLNLAYHYQYEAFRAATADELDRSRELLAAAKPYCINPDTHLRQGFLWYLTGEKQLALKEFRKAQSSPDFRKLWEALIAIRPDFAAVEEDEEFQRQLFDEP